MERFSVNNFDRNFPQILDNKIISNLHFTFQPEQQLCVCHAHCTLLCTRSRPRLCPRNRLTDVHRTNVLSEVFNRLATKRARSNFWIYNLSTRSFSAVCIGAASFFWWYSACFSRATLIAASVIRTSPHVILTNSCMHLTSTKLSDHAPLGLQQAW